MSGSTRSASSEIYIGLMSGTSLDGVDSVLVDLRRRPLLLGAGFLPYPKTLKVNLLALHETSDDELHRAALAGIELSKLYAKAADRLLDKHGVSAQAVSAIGCHGQTVRHRPGSGYSLQLGSPAWLAERTGITVVADFRSRDIAAGGQGAPLVPAFHAAVFRDSRRHRVIVNLGGIANLTDLPRKGSVTGFDTGPGNVLLDTWARERFGADFDRGGALAAKGRPVASLLKRLLADPYFHPIEAIRYHLESRGLSEGALEPFLGSRVRVAEVMGRKRPLSLAMIRRLHAGLGISADLLIQPYSLITSATGSV